MTKLKDYKMKLIMEELIPLQDYRWLSIETFDNKPCTRTTNEFIRTYINSEAYNKAYVECGQSETHGPFLLSRISEKNYEEVTLEQAAKEFDNTIKTHDFADEYSELRSDLCEDIITRVMALIEKSISCFRLRLDPLEDESYRHELGFPIWEFNEFVFISKNFNTLTVFIFGYD